VGKDGLPTFRYRRGGVTFTETIRPLPDGKGIERAFTTDGKVPLAVTIGAEADISSSTGNFAITAGQSKSFTLTFRWK
jgi:hypothetical protein